MCCSRWEITSMEKSTFNGRTAYRPRGPGIVSPRVFRRRGGASGRVERRGNIPSYRTSANRRRVFTRLWFSDEGTGELLILTKRAPSRSYRQLFAPTAHYLLAVCSNRILIFPRRLAAPPTLFVLINRARPPAPLPVVRSPRIVILISSSR